MSVLSPLGLDLAGTLAAIQNGQSAVRVIPEWENIPGLKTCLGAYLPEFDFPVGFTKKATRCMGRGARLATYSAELALRQAGLVSESGERSALLSDGKCGIAYGSGIGSLDSLSDLSAFLATGQSAGVTATTYLRVMSHTTAANIGMYFGVNGRIIPTSSACTSGSLGIGYAYEAIRSGRQSRMIAGGAEEFSSIIALIFDALFACSRSREQAPRPFDRMRDGMVVGEGASSFILEDLEQAQARGAAILAEVVGFGTNSDGSHATSPTLETVEQCLQLALEDAGLAPSDISYVNAHATGTKVGDIIESSATHAVFGSDIDVSSLKGHFGHLLGASGAVESAVSIAMLKSGWLAPTLRLKEVDPECADLNYLKEITPVSGEFVMSNTFAFGGVNTSLIFRAPTGGGC